MNDSNYGKPEKKKILITVKTIPTESTEYEETVCTAGITEDKKWIRIYPVPYRKLSQNQQYEKYQWIEAEVFRNSKDFRPESYKCNWESIRLLNSVQDWGERYKLCIEGMRIYEDFDELISLAKTNPPSLSLAIFNPKKIIKCEVLPRDISDQLEKQDQIRAARVMDLFDDKPFKPAKPLPFKLTYTFLDSNDKRHTLMVEDWEAYMLFSRFEKSGFEVAKEKVEQKYKELVSSNHRTLLFVGTRLTAHYKTLNPFSIIGIFYPPKDIQQPLF